MKRICSMILSVCLFLTMTGITVSAESLSDFEAKTYSNEKYDYAMPYQLFVPSNYDTEKEYPLVLFLHGAGERGNDNNHVNATSPLADLVSAANLVNYPCIIVAPQCPADAQWVDTPWGNGSYSVDDVPVSEPMSMVMDILDEVRSTYNIDSNRNYAIGISMGGYGVWDIIMRNPDMFAAAIPICGAGDPQKAEVIKDIPIWTFHGDSDPTVPVEGTREMVAALEAVEGNMQYTEYPGVDHKSWVNAYAEPEFFGWLFDQTKAPRENQIFESSHFENNSLDGWKAQTDGSGKITAGDGIVNLAASGGEGQPGSQEPIVIEKGKPYLINSIGSSREECAGWAFNDAKNGVRVFDGVMRFESIDNTLAQAQYNFKPDTNTFVSEFDLRLHYDDTVASNVAAGIQIFDGTYRNYVQVLPAQINVFSNPTVNLKEYTTPSDVWYTYRMEQSAGHLSIMRKAEGQETFEIVAENLVMNTNGATAAFKFYMEKSGMSAEIRNVAVHSTSTRPVANPVSFGEGRTVTDDFEEANITDTGWVTSSSTITLDDAADALHIKANGTAAQSVTKTIDDFSKLEFEMRYRMNGTSSRGINIGLLNRTHRAVLGVYPDAINLRSHNPGDTAGGFFPAKNIVTAPDTWYTLKVVMERYDAAGSDYRYAVYRKADNEDEYRCIASNLPACTMESSRSYINLYLEGDAAADCTVDYIKTTTYEMETAGSSGVQMISKPIQPSASYTAEFRVRLNRNIASNGANFGIYNGGRRVFMRIQPNQVTLVDAENENISYKIENTPGVWYTYLVNVKDFGYADVYRKAEGETEYTKIIDNQSLQARNGSRRADIFIEGNPEQNIDLDYFRIYKGVVVDTVKLTYDDAAAEQLKDGVLQVTAQICNGTEAPAELIQTAAAYENGRLGHVDYEKHTVNGLESKPVTVEVQTTGSEDTVKCFFWDSLKTVRPFSNAGAYVREYGA